MVYKSLNHYQLIIHKKGGNYFMVSRFFLFQNLSNGSHLLKYVSACRETLKACFT